MIYKKPEIIWVFLCPKFTHSLLPKQKIKIGKKVGAFLDSLGVRKVVELFPQEMPGNVEAKLRIQQILKLRSFHKATTHMCECKLWLISGIIAFMISGHHDEPFKVNMDAAINSFK